MGINRGWGGRNGDRQRLVQRKGYVGCDEHTWPYYDCPDCNGPVDKKTGEHAAVMSLSEFMAMEGCAEAPERDDCPPAQSTPPPKTTFAEICEAWANLRPRVSLGHVFAARKARRGRP